MAGFLSKAALIFSHAFGFENQPDWDRLFCTVERLIRGRDEPTEIIADLITPKKQGRLIFPLIIIESVTLKSCATLFG